MSQSPVRPDQDPQTSPATTPDDDPGPRPGEADPTEEQPVLDPQPPTHAPD